MGIEKDAHVQSANSRRMPHTGDREFSCKLMKKVLLVSLFLCAQSAAAMSLGGAGENILYFEHAKLSAEHCERRGFSVRSALEAWQQKNNQLYRRSEQAIRAHAAKGGLSKTEQDAVLLASIENQQRLSQDNIAKKGVRCTDFEGVLSMYSTLFKQ
jgi:hypothetical protein